MSNGYFGIPTIDISERTDLQTVVDREKGQYLGHVTTAMLEDQKTVYAAYPKCHAVGQIVLKRSDDGGKTWSDRLPVPSSWTHSLECPTIYRMCDAQGKSRLVLFSGGYPANRSYSEDNGLTWTEFQPFDFGGILFLSTMVNIGPGKYLALFHDEGQFIHGGNDVRWQVFATGEGKNRRSSVSYLESPDGGRTWNEERKYWFVQPTRKPGEEWTLDYETFSSRVFDDNHFELYQIMTEDGGLTWTQPRVIANHPVGRLCEPCIIPSPDGKQLAVLLRENSRQLNSMMILSNDCGETWSEPVELPNSLTGDRHTMKYLSDGRLFITFRDMAKDSCTKGDWVAWVGTFDDIVNGKDGQYRVLIKRNPDSWDCAYPGLELLADGSLLTVTYGHWDKGEEPYIVAVHIDPKELDDKYHGLID